MKKINTLFILFTGFVVMSFSPEFTAVKDTEALKIAIKAKAKELNTITSDFSQTKHISFLESKIQSKGKFYFKKENQLKWKYTSPYTYEIIMSDGKVSINDGGNKSSFDAKSSKNFTELNDLLVGSVTGDIFESDKFDITYLQNEKYYVLTLEPTSVSMKKNLKKILLFLDHQNYSVEIVKMIEPSDDYTLISFKNKKLNAPLPSNTFSTN